MTSHPSSPHHSARHQSAGLMLIILLLIGVAATIYGTVAYDVSSRRLLEQRAATIATALPVDDIESLEGSENDADTVAYKSLRKKLIAIRQQNPDMEFVYLMGIRAGQVHFLVDSEHENSDDYSPPGSAYPEASDRLHRAFENKEPFVEGPLVDSYGSWLSGIAPVVDSDTGQIEAVVGIDVSSSTFYRNAVLLSAVPVSILLAFPTWFLLRQRKTFAQEHEYVRVRSEFISIASHELRSPLSGMLWAIQSLLKSKSLNKDHENMLRNMYQSTQSSIATVNEILDATIFERNQNATLRHDFVELTSIMTTVKSTLSLAAEEKNLTIKIGKTWPESAFAFGDVAALKRAYMNILANAIKYSAESKTIEISYIHKNSEHYITIKDHGIGIPKADVSKVLKGYYRAQNATKVSTQGTGMGMFVTRKIIEDHGGRLEVSSHEGEGTSVTIVLPEAQPLAQHND